MNETQETIETPSDPLKSAPPTMAGEVLPLEPNLFTDLGFDERAVKEIQLALLYAKDFAHGTDGHIRLILIANLSTVVINMVKTISAAARRENMDVSAYLETMDEWEHERKGGALPVAANA